MDADSEYVLLFVNMCLVHIFCVVAFFLLQAKWAKLCGVPVQSPHQIAHCDPCDTCGSFCGQVGKFVPLCFFSVDVVKHLSFFK